MVKKKLALLGATGSIGKSALQVVKEQADKIKIVLASAHNNSDELFRAASEFNIPLLVLTDERLKSAALTPPEGCSLYFGEEELRRLLQEEDYDLALNGISGSAGLNASLEVLATGKTLALANKESLVMAGHLVKELQQKHHSLLLPVDSEHSALFQAIGNHPAEEIAKVYITASGGAFRSVPPEDFPHLTWEQALRHPNWSMGVKVTLDSATMFNKALEVIEAHWLFNLDWKQITAVLHPQSVIHSLVEFIDGSFLAQMSVPDMKLPILYALSYPQRFPSQLVKTDLLHLSPLTFAPIEKEKYPLFYLGVEAGKQGGIMPTVANAANEAALQLFQAGKISFPQIAEIVYHALSKAKNIPAPDRETILAVNAEVYAETLALKLN
ncbi:MAG TPA: 1-deoxy-D-xylulose-5-phosphate reductoisomerase [Candidatus Cloacimonadota bacterium]|nr:1-deoxy-D-xylulose-5-phosphate reductoisomerase [Candidatus Cloacimonadota bacterium]